MVDPNARAQIRQAGAEFDRLIDGRLVKLRAALPPSDIPFPAPSATAVQLSYALAAEALPRLSADINAWGGSTQYVKPNETVVDLPYSTADAVAARHGQFGVPLTGACSPDALDDVAVRQIAARTVKLTRLEEREPFIDEQLNRLVGNEHALWARSGSSRWPYAFAYLALLWFGPGDREQRVPRLVPCLRCGRLLRPATWTSLNPRCANCVKEPAGSRLWPDGAVMPAGRGTWWLACGHRACDRGPGGLPYFVGERRAIYCRAHATARLSKRDRAARTSQPPAD